MFSSSKSMENKIDSRFTRDQRIRVCLSICSFLSTREYADIQSNSRLHNLRKLHCLDYSNY